VVLGNCGFGFSQVRPADRERAMLTMSRTEAIGLEAMKEGMLWEWETIPEWLDFLDRIPKGVNCSGYAAILPLMYWVMGPEAAKQRPPTPAEQAEIDRLLGQAMQAGSCGWSSQRMGEATAQTDFDGSPMATDLIQEYDDGRIPLALLGGRVEHYLIEGVAADVIVYDPTRIRRVPGWTAGEIVQDRPAGEWRRIQRAQGCHWRPWSTARSASRATLEPAPRRDACSGTGAPRAPRPRDPDAVPGRDDGSRRLRSSVAWYPGRHHHGWSSRMERESRLHKVVDGSAWAEFCDTLKNAGEVVQRELSPTDPLDRAEGYRYLSRLTRLALEKFVESSDPATPRLYRLTHETAKIGCDNPDCLYENARISSEYEYRITGTRGTIHYLAFGTYYGDYGKPGRSGCSGYLEAADLETNADGSFEVTVSLDERPGNWLPMEHDTSMLIVRQYYMDREKERPAEFQMERLGAKGPPPALAPEAFAEGLEDAANYVAATAALFTDWAEGFLERPNALTRLDPALTGGAHGDPNIAYRMGYWELAPDEALLIEATPPKCEYWNFQLNNHWMESLDYRHHTIHYNQHTATQGEDGSVRLVVAHQDPGVPNWVDTAGHARGTMGLRWVKADLDPDPELRVVRFSEIAGGRR
jgi:hypothetical protein